MERVIEVENNQIAKTILYNGFATGQQNHLYIVVGDSLEQQRTLYKWFIKLHICERRSEWRVCNTCTRCLQVEHNNYINNIVVARDEDKKSIGIDALHELQAAFVTTSHIHAERFFCIEEAETLTVQAINSILKFLEEPQGNTIGFLFTTNETKLLPTIRSRGQLLRLLPAEDEEQRHRIGKKIADPSLRVAARFLLSLGYEEKTVLKQTPLLNEVVRSFVETLARGVPPIVAQIELEAFVKKTKSGTMALEFLTHYIDSCLKDDVVETNEDIRLFLTKFGHSVYIAAANALENKRYHFGNSMLLTDFSLRLTEEISEAQV